MHKNKTFAFAPFISDIPQKDCFLNCGYLKDSAFLGIVQSLDGEREERAIRQCEEQSSVQPFL